MTQTMYDSPAARAYVRAVEKLLRVSPATARTRGAFAPDVAADMAEQAEHLSGLSAALTKAAETRLDDPNPAVREEASAQLLAKALTDLEISAYLLQAALDEEAAPEFDTGSGLRLWSAGLDSVEPYLRLLLGEAGIWPALAERDEVPPTDISTARVELSNAVTDSLAFISERAVYSGQAALGGLLGLGVVEVAQAAGIVGKDIADALGQSEKIGRLFAAFRAFALESYDSLLVLLGRQLAQRAAEWVLEWLDELKAGQLFGQVLEKLFQTIPTGQQVQQWVSESRSELEGYLASIRGVDALNEGYRRQTELATKILRALAFFGTLPMAVLPQPRVFLGAAYIILAAYVVLCGGDYVDAPKLRILDRVPGVLQIVEANL